MSVSPYLRKGASRDPKKIIPLPWDAKETAKEKAPAMVLTKEEADAEFDELIRARRAT